MFHYFLKWIKFVQLCFDTAHQSKYVGQREKKLICIKKEQFITTLVEKCKIKTMFKERRERKLRKFEILFMLSIKQKWAEYAINILCNEVM